MVKKCIVTGKQVTGGYTVSHSNQHTKRRVFPNLQKRRLKNPTTGKMVRVLVSNRGLRILKKWDKEGKAYDLERMAREAK